MKNTLKLIIMIVSVSLLYTSCSDNFLDVNTDPNNPLTVSPDLALPVAQRYTAYSLTQPNNSARKLNTLGNILMQNWSQSDGYNWYVDEFAYLVNPNFYTSIWDYQYQNTLKQYHTLDVTTANFEYYAAISKIMKSMHFQILVDTYGDIPYFEALQRGENPTPAFNTGREVYTDLIVQLDNAINMINAGALNPDVIAPGIDDAMFNGNMLQWKQLANTIKLRILVRQAGATSTPAGYVASEFSKINTEGSGYLTQDATFNPGYTAQENQQNPFWDQNGQNTAGDPINTNLATCATEYVLGKLNTLGDPRIDFIYEKPAGGHLGVPQGLIPYPLPVGTLGDENVSNLGPGVLKGADQDSVIFTLAEAEFLQAQAAMLSPSFVSGNAESHFDAGVNASFNYLGASGAGVYVASGIDLADFSASTNQMEAIITQKWIALNSIDAIQSWFDFNKTGFPSDLPISLSASQPNIPVRLSYPSSEISGNGANVPTQPNVFSSRIFWAN